MQALTFFFAFVAVLALIGAAAWLVRRFAGNRLGANANRSRMPRLAVIDAAAVDGRRRLVLVRRDNVEHLLMIGGPTDIVVEPNIVRASPARDSAPQRPAAGELPRLPPHAEAGIRPDGDGVHDLAEPHIPEPLPPRPARPAFADEMRRPAAPAIAERRADPLMSGFVPEPPSRPEPRPEPRLEPRVEPPPRLTRSEPPLMPRAPRPAAAEPPPARAPAMRAAERTAPPPVPAPPAAPPNVSAAADQNLADMAQRLEAALRRPAGDTRPEPAEPRVGAPPVAPEPPSGRPAPRPSGDIAATRNEAPAAAKTGFENLEDEMASLLGRPKTPS
jgi:flagellar protein FliO/FliZ